MSIDTLKISHDDNDDDNDNDDLAITVARPFLRNRRANK